MTTERLVSAHKAAPFKPFTIYMVDGARYHVDHPEFFAYRPGSRSAYIDLGDERSVFLDTMLISQIMFGDTKLDH